MWQLHEVIGLQALSVLLLPRPWICVTCGPTWLMTIPFEPSGRRKRGDMPFPFKSRTWKLHILFLSRPLWPAFSYLTTPSYERTGKCGLYPKWLFCPAKYSFMEDKKRGVGGRHLFLLKPLGTQTAYAWLL